MFWFGRLPLTVRIPLAVTACFLIICVALISLALHGATRQFDRQITDLGQVYLDGLSAALMPAVASGGREEIEAVLNRALDTHVGVIDRTLALVSLQGKVTAMVVRSPDNDPLPDTATLMDGPGNTLMGAGGNSVWTWRALDANDPARGVVVANLDVAGFQQQRNKLALELVLAGLAISLVGAGLALLLTRRIQRPIILLTQRLRAAQRQPPQALDERAFARDPELRELLAAYNWMVSGVNERSALAGRHARIEREALLGRMSAALAHEVRNPLGGMRTALQTLRQFGEQARVRHEAIDFVDRGIEALQAVVDANLRTFRPGEAQHMLTQHDIEDVRLLVGAQASKKAVLLEVQGDLGAHSVPLPAGPVRQILLNLVLNAVAASPVGATVNVLAHAQATVLTLRVTDQGPGFPAHVLGDPEGPAQETERIGLEVVRDLVRGLGGRLLISDGRSGGAAVEVMMPIMMGDSE